MAFQSDRSNPLPLFQQHFLLFHCLYRLQQELYAQQSAQLQISPLQIILLPYYSNETGALAEADPVRSYYLDLSQLARTGAEDVDALLAEFWVRLSRHSRRNEALRILGLSDPVDDTTIRRRYRELVMAHHPDRGGDKDRLQLINAALADLLPRKL